MALIQDIMEGKNKWNNKELHQLATLFCLLGCIDRKKRNRYKVWILWKLSLWQHKTRKIWGNGQINIWDKGKKV